MKYKVTNKKDDVRKFRDSFLGKDVLVEPKGFVLTNKPPKDDETWNVELAEKSEKKKTQPILKEENKHGRSSSK